MAAKKQKVRPSPLDDPPTASSSSSDEEHSSEEEEVSSQEEEKDHSPPPPANSQHSSSETESGSETESEPEPDATTFKVKPLASKPMTQAQKPKAQPSPVPSKSVSKRASENNTESANVTDPKRSKKKSSNSSSTVPAAAAAADTSDEKVEEDEKKGGDHLKKFPRRWSEEDELAILKGVIDFSSKTGQDPLKLSNADNFHTFMNKSLDVEISRNQLKEKLRRMKKKFETIAGKVVNGEGISFSKPHEQKAYELSKKAWGSDQGGEEEASGVVEKPKSNGSVPKSPKRKENGSRNVASAKKPKSELVPATSLEVKESEKMEIDQGQDSDNVCLILRELHRSKVAPGLDDNEVKRGLELIGKSKRAELEAKWMALRNAEMDLFARRSELGAENIKLMVEALRSSHN